MSLRNKLRCVGLTDTGKVREHNEDTIAVDADIGLLVLADGMGIDQRGRSCPRGESTGPGAGSVARISRLIDFGTG